jgi:hypothetical protein
MVLPLITKFSRKGQLWVSLQTLSSSSVGIGFAYFVGSFIVMNFLMIPVARSTFIVNQGEGFFRFRHARLKEFAECGMSVQIRGFVQVS